MVTSGWGLWAMSIFGTIRPDDRMQYCAAHNEHYFHWCGQCAADMQQDDLAAAAPLTDAQRGAVREAEEFTAAFDAHADALAASIATGGEG